VNPWWLRPPAEEGPAKDPKPQVPAKKTEDRKQPEPQGDKAAPSQRRSGRGGGAKRRRSPAAKGKPKAPAERRIAVFYDVESSDQGLDLDLILGRVAEKGRIIAKRAYGDWRLHGDQKEGIRQADFEIVDQPQGQIAGRGSVGIQLAVDAVELGVSKDACEVFVLISGNGDFSPLVVKLREAGADVVGVGARGTASAGLVGGCNEYLYSEELVQPTAPPTVQEGVDEAKEPAFALLVETIESLEAASEGIIWGSTLKREIRRRQPKFDETSIGYATFTDLLEDAERHEVIQLERDDRSGGYYVAGLVRK
jgi:hypothetical protein